MDRPSTDRGWSIRGFRTRKIVQHAFDDHFLVFPFPSRQIIPNLNIMNLEDRFRAVRQQIRARQPLQQRIDLVRNRIAARRQRGTAEPRTIQVPPPQDGTAR